jgi:tetratricopeptide (TPR) repeat protein
MLTRYDDAITAADAALSQEGNLTTTHSIAWYNKGNALRALGKIPEAREAYAKAYALDNNLVPPDMVTGSVTPVPPPTTTSSPVPWFMVPAGFGLLIWVRNYRRKSEE